MKIFFKTLEELQQCVKVNADTTVESLTPYIAIAQEKYLPTYLGTTLYNSLLNYYNDDNAVDNADYNGILPYIQRALANYALYHATDHFNVYFGDSGFTTAASNNMVPASKERVALYKQSCLDLAHEGIEQLLNYLELNKTDFDEWVQSSASTINTRFTLRTAVQYSNFVDINNSRLVFIKIWPHLDRALEQIIYPNISKDLYDRLNTDLTSPADDNYIALLPKVNSLLAFYSYSYYLQATQGEAMVIALYNNYGAAKLKELVDYLIANATNYPEYANSPQFTANSPKGLVDNSNRTGLFIAGTPLT